MAMDVGTETAAIARTVYDAVLLEYRYAKQLVTRRFIDKSREAQGAYNVSVPYLPTLNAQNVTAATGAVTDTDATVAASTLALSLWRSVGCTITDQTFFASKTDLELKIRMAIGAAIGDDIDSAFLDELGANMTGLTDQGDGTGDVGKGDLLGAVKQLLDKDLDAINNPGEFTFVFTPGQWRVLKEIGEFNDASKMGSGPGGMLTPRLPDVLGIPTIITSEVYSSTYRYNILAHREAGAWGLSSGVRIESARPAGYLATQYVGHYGGGVKTIRSDYGVRLVTKS